uniref:Uncharacterized protein n=1 Tax=Eptatretus burgeri TaxID=7764 RepID=A0A8C4X1P1_EPTBU
MTTWLARSHGDAAYWEGAAGNFRHALGLCCELAGEFVHNFTQHELGWEGLLCSMLRELFHLLVSCISEPAEAISRVGCSCVHYILVVAGPAFSEDMWRLATEALQQAFSATLEPLKDLLACFSSDENGTRNEGYEVKVAAPRLGAASEVDSWRVRAMAQQVFALDGGTAGRDSLDHSLSCVFILELPADGHQTCGTEGAVKRLPFRTLVVRLLSHQVLLQHLHELLVSDHGCTLPCPTSVGSESSPDMTHNVEHSVSFEEAATADQAAQMLSSSTSPTPCSLPPETTTLQNQSSPSSISTPLTTGPLKTRANPGSSFSSETGEKGLGSYTPFMSLLPPHVLAAFLDLPLVSLAAARAFEGRPSLRCLLGRVASAGPGPAASLQRQAAMAAAVYGEALLAALSQTADTDLTANKVKHLLREEQDNMISSDSSVPSSAQSSDTDNEDRSACSQRDNILSGGENGKCGDPSLAVPAPADPADWRWLLMRVKRFYSDMCEAYIQLHLDLADGALRPSEALFLLPISQPDTIWTSPLSSPPAVVATPPTPPPSATNFASLHSTSQGEYVNYTDDLFPAPSLRAPCSPVEGPPGEPCNRWRTGEWWEGAGGRLYTVATDHTVRRLISEYKKRKQRHKQTMLLSSLGKAPAAAPVVIEEPEASPVAEIESDLAQEVDKEIHQVSVASSGHRSRSASQSSACHSAVASRDAEMQLKTWHDGCAQSADGFGCQLLFVVCPREIVRPKSLWD